MSNIFKYIGILFPLISAIEKLKGAGNGAEKRKAVIELFRLVTSLAGGAGVISETDAKFVGQLIDLIVAYLNETGRWNDPVPVPAPSAEYGVSFSMSIEPSDDQLKAKGFVAGDRLFASLMVGGEWRVYKANDDNVNGMWEFVRAIS